MVLNSRVSKVFKHYKTEHFILTLTQSGILSSILSNSIKLRFNLHLIITRILRELASFIYHN